VYTTCILEGAFFFQSINLLIKEKNNNKITKKKKPLIYRSYYFSYYSFIVSHTKVIGTLTLYDKPKDLVKNK